MRTALFVYFKQNIAILTIRNPDSSDYSDYSDSSDYSAPSDFSDNSDSFLMVSKYC